VVDKPFAISLILSFAVGAAIHKANTRINSGGRIFPSLEFAGSKPPLNRIVAVHERACRQTGTTQRCLIENLKTGNKKIFY
jgi:hypothetical protein